MKPLTDKQRRMVVFIGEYTRKNGISPNFREVSKGVGYAGSVNAIRQSLQTLRDRGLLTFDDGKGRTLRLCDAGKKLLPPLPVKTRTVKILDDAGLRVLAARMREKDLHGTTLGGEA